MYEVEGFYALLSRARAKSSAAFFTEASGGVRVFGVQSKLPPPNSAKLSSYRAFMQFRAVLRKREGDLLFHKDLLPVHEKLFAFLSLKKYF
ncbi:MAG: hypothetical protein EAZ92_01105 [Candidatus Kapaibacterium sp.]|nr:MAG: hypothetical protein EAZ92_01105 [Candidatus Kapabacteria bacterium]